MVAERGGKPVRNIELSSGPWGGPLKTSIRAMAQPSEPRPEVIEDEEEKMQSPSTPITPPGRNPSVLPGVVVGSHATSPATSESGAAPTRLELQRQIRQQRKLQQQSKSRLVRATLNMQGSLEAAQAKLDSNTAELWEAIEDMVQERKQKSRPSKAPWTIRWRCSRK